MVNSNHARYAGKMKDQLGTLLGYQLSRAAAASLARLNRALKSLQLRHIDASILLSIDGNPNVTPTQMCGTLGIARANMVPLIARLEARGVIERARLNGRSFGLCLTDQGRVLVQTARVIIAEHEAWLSQGLGTDPTEPQRNKLQRLWDQST
jgi:DNA-binding MarR family transcriptional regulator